MKRVAPILLALLAAATLLLVVRGLAVGPSGAGAAGGTAGLRVVDMDRYLRRVQEHTLSDVEARWWVPAPP